MFIVKIGGTIFHIRIFSGINKITSRFCNFFFLKEIKE